ncbi:MAG: hypothetical protein K8R68_12205 [Bacteroidales bacterium]|nr:hypothetical protein [Bacteroidales bacterium]
MISVAAKVWGITNKDIEKNDPLVPLLLDVCASELAKVSSSIMSGQDKIGNKLMELLTPEELTSPYPARAILYAHPMDSTCKINENNEFYFNKRNFTADEDKDIEVYFTPTGNYKLINGEIGYLANYKSIFKILNPFEREDFCRSNSAKIIDSNYLWIGLYVPNSVESLNGASFYFDMDNVTEIEEEIFYQALSTSNWDINGNKINVIDGFEINSDDNLKKLPNIPTHEFNKSRSICNRVNNFYKKRFITISEKDNNSIDYKGFTQKYPDFFKDIFDEKSLKEIEGKLLWVKISFVHHIPSEILDKVKCSINCFPVINRREEKVYISGNEKIKGITSEEHEMYFDLKHVSAEENMEVILERNKPGNAEGKAILTLRQDNLGRFNSRNAFETIQQLIDVYREEFTAFSRFKSISQDAIDNLNNAIRPFENVIDEIYNISVDTMPYVLLKTEPDKEDVNVEVGYWLTNGNFANDIQKEEALRYDSAEIIREKIFLMTTTYGGVDKKKNEELINDFRYALLSRDRIVTIADIKALCFKVFENSIETIDVREGISAGTQPDSGLRRTIEINIKLIKNLNLKDDAIKFLKEDLETQLEEKSLNVLPFKVLVK